MTAAYRVWHNLSLGHVQLFLPFFLFTDVDKKGNLLLNIRAYQIFSPVGLIVVDDNNLGDV